MFKKLSAALALLITSSQAIALEPLSENRARVQTMQAELLLPNNSSLPVNMSFDCGSQWENTGMIITSRQGAEILAAAFTHLYGAAAGQAVINKWETKENPTDPRLPTFIIVTPPPGMSFGYSTQSTPMSAKSINALASSKAITSEDKPPIAMLNSSCGTRIHPVQ